MKHKISTLLIAIACLGCGGREYLEEKETKQQKVIVSALKVREQPNQQSKAIATLPSDAVITTIAKTEKVDTIKIKGVEEIAPWYKVDQNGQIGWVFGGCLTDKLPSPNRLKIDKKIIQSGQVWVLNDTLIDCKISQKDQETEIYVFTIAFLDGETAITHSFSTAGHTNENIIKIKYRIENDLLKLYFPSKELNLAGLDDAAEWELVASTASTTELELQKCGDKNIFKLVGDDFYMGEETNLDYQESFEDIQKLINQPQVRELFERL